MTAGDIYRALWRHKFFITVLTAACIGATWYATSQQTRKYQASALVRIQEGGPSAGDFSALQASQLLAQTYAQVIGSGALKGRIETLVARRVAAGKVPEVKISGQPVPNLDLLSITALSKNPTRALIVANAVPVALMSFIRDTGTRNVQVVIVKAATMPTSPVSRHMARNITIAFMLGLIFNGALALLIELLRDRLPESEELGQTVGHPVLATIPALRLQLAPSKLPERSGTSALAIEQSLGHDVGSHASGPRAGPRS